MAAPATPAGATPLPSGADAAEEAEEAEEVELDKEIDEEDERPRPQAPAFKFSTFLYTFLFLLGILMIFDTSTRYGVALAFDRALSPLIGFGGAYPLVTMALAAAFEMLLTAVAYNYTTDWLKAARVQKWSAAFRKVQMAAMRSGKKDRIAALQEHQSTLTRLSTEVSFAQLKGMAITWFLVIALYSWVYLYLIHSPAFPTSVWAHCASPPAAGASCSRVIVSLGDGVQFNLLGYLIGPIQAWFLVFSLYTVPLSLVFRRALKDYSLRRELRARGAAPTAPPVPLRGSA